MKDNATVKKFYNKLVLESLLKSFVWGGTIAFSAMFLTAFICWFTTDLGLWISLGVFAAVLAAAVPAFYFLRFRPTYNDLAKRIDGLGLEERIITMCELEHDDRYIALRQRDDAYEALKRTAADKMKICLTALSTCALAVSAVLGGGMTVVNALAAEEIIPPGGDIGTIINPPEETYIEINYVVVGYDYEGNEVADYGGMIEGDDFQLVVTGGSGTPVLAVADEDEEEIDGVVYFWAFVCWDMDENQNDPYRLDVDVYGDGGEIGEDGQIVVTHTAIFMQVGGSGEPSEGDGDSDGDPDQPQDAPDSSEGDDSNNGNSGSSGDNEGGDGAGGKYEDKNQIIDGNQYYRDRYDEYYQKAQEFINRGEEVPEHIKKLLDYYYDIIK